MLRIGEVKDSGGTLMGTLAAPLLSSRPKIDLTILLALGIHVECADRHWGSEKKEGIKEDLSVPAAVVNMRMRDVCETWPYHKQRGCIQQDREKEKKKEKLAIPCKKLLTWMCADVLHAHGSSTGGDG